jgi:hypothetical protein
VLLPLSALMFVALFTKSCLPLVNYKDTAQYVTQSFANKAPRKRKNHCIEDDNLRLPDVRLTAGVWGNVFSYYWGWSPGDRPDPTSDLENHPRGVCLLRGRKGVYLRKIRRPAPVQTANLGRHKWHLVWFYDGVVRAPRFKTC